MTKTDLHGGLKDHHVGRGCVLIWLAGFFGIIAVRVASNVVRGGFHLRVLEGSC